MHRRNLLKSDKSLICFRSAKELADQLGHARDQAVSVGRIASILEQRGQTDEALRIRREEELPVYERLGDVRSKAVTMGQIADILHQRGQTDEALRIYREECLPVCEGLGDVRSQATCKWAIGMMLIHRKNHKDYREGLEHLQWAVETAERLQLGEAAPLRQTLNRLLGK